MQVTKAWRILSFVVVLALILTAAPGAVMAQTPVVASEIRGELNEQFAKHYLGLRVTDQSKPVVITMDYNPQTEGSVDENAGFYVFEATGFARYVSGTPARTSALGIGTLQTVAGLKQKVNVIASPVGTFSVVVYNDTVIPVAYTLTAENAEFVDASGEQVEDVNAPAAAEEAEDETAETTETATPEATETATPEPEATETAEAEVVEETAAPSGTPRKVRASKLSGDLPERFDKHYFGFETTGTSATLKLTVDPQDNSEVQQKVDAFLLTESQMAALVSGAATNLYANNTAIPQVPGGSPGPTKVAEFTAPKAGTRYTVIVGNDSTIPASYTVEVTGGVLEDGSAQSKTAQARQSAGASATATATATAITGGATAETTTVAAAAAGAITPGTSYTVARGDTLGTIATRAFGASRYWRAICNANSLANCNVIEVGDVLEIPTRAEADTLLASAGTAAPAATTPTPAATTPAPTPEATPEATTAATPEPTPEPTTEPAAETGTPATGNLTEVAAASRQFEILLLALDLAGLTDSIANGGPFTVFAPTDAAFASLPEATLDTLLADPALLAEVLQFHVVPGNLSAADLAGGISLETLQGASITVDAGADGSLTVDGATVIEADVNATNGVIHVINQVLLPPEN